MFKKIFQGFLFCLLGVGGGLPTFSQAQNSLTVGIISYKSDEAVRSSYEPLLAHLARESGRSLRLELVSESELAFHLIQGKVDLGVFTPFPYLLATSNHPELEVFASHQVWGKNVYQGGILVRKDAGINALHELAGQRFLFVKNSSTSGFKLPKGILLERGHDIEANFFQSYAFSGGHGASLDALLAGETDGIAIDLKAWQELPASDTAQLRLLTKYEVPYHAYVFAPGLDAEVKESIKEQMFAAHQDPANQALFQNVLHIERWHPQTDEAYNSLRRYLRIGRKKPQLSIQFELKPGAQKALEAEGDILSLMEERCYNRLINSQRFTELGKSDSLRNLSHQVKVGLSMLGDQYHYTLYLDQASIAEGELNAKQLVTHLPGILNEEVMASLPFKGPLLTDGDKWFILFGKSDGLAGKALRFEFSDPQTGQVLGTLNEEALTSINDLNTYFVEQEFFLDHLEVEAHYLVDADEYPKGMAPAEVGETSFWDSPDNQWGVVGLVVALITVTLGSYFTGRRKRRFRHMLNESNTLLQAYLSDKQRFDNKLLAQKNKIHTFLEKGHITENQFLILNHRIEDIDLIVNKFLLSKKPVAPEIREEIDEIIKDGIITEKEFTRIVSMVKKHAEMG
ncbi:MAG: PhnD/SsuA/transferrin family substrate-binding protein [Bacteroidota bacterium]